MTDTNQAVGIIEKVVLLTQGNMERVKEKSIYQVNLKPHEKKSISYARCRAAINSDCFSFFKDNAAGAKNFKKAHKKESIEFLGGKVEWKDQKKFVVFPDGSQARY